MRKTGLLVIGVGIAFVLAMGIFLENRATVEAAEMCSIVTVLGRDNIEPTMLTVKKGGCVVWLNWT